MKKLICLLLCIGILVALTGCVNSVDSTSVPTDPAVTQPTGNQNVQPTTGSQDSGSQPEDKDYRMPTVDTDYWELLCENCDITMYFDTTRETFLMFPLLSAQDLDGKMMSITTDLGVSAECEIIKENEATEFPFYTFLMYQDFDWSTLDTDAYARAQIEAPWQEIYKGIKKDLPSLYVYRMYFPLDWLGIDATASAPQQIKSLAVTVEGRTQTYDLGNVRFLPGKLDANTSYTGGLSNKSGLCISCYSVDISENGMLELPHWDLEAKQDLVLQGIHVLDHEEITVLSCDLSITTPTGDTFNMRWDAETPIEVDAGSKIRLDLVLGDPFLAGTMEANILRYILVDYTNNDEAFSAVMYISCRVWTNSHDIYVTKLDSVDMRLYYFEYRNYGKQ